MTRKVDDSPESKEERLRLAAELADGFDEAQAVAYKVAARTRWSEVADAGPYAGGPPAVAARLYTPQGGKAFPRLRLAVQGDDARGYALVVCVKDADGDPDAGWETVRIPRSLLAAAGRLLMACA